MPYKFPHPHHHMLTTPCVAQTICSPNSARQPALFRSYITETNSRRMSSGAMYHRRILWPPGDSCEISLAAWMVIYVFNAHQHPQLPTKAVTASKKPFNLRPTAGHEVVSNVNLQRPMTGTPHPPSPAWYRRRPRRPNLSPSSSLTFYSLRSISWDIKMHLGVSQIPVAAKLAAVTAPSITNWLKGRCKQKQSKSRPHLSRYDSRSKDGVPLNEAAVPAPLRARRCRWPHVFMSCQLKHCHHPSVYALSSTSTASMSLLK